MSAREQIAAGPAFEADVPDRDGARCVCGDGVAGRDTFTGLCRPCWRAWRWAAKREEGRPGAPAQPATPVETS